MNVYGQFGRMRWVFWVGLIILSLCLLGGAGLRKVVVRAAKLSDGQPSAALLLDSIDEQPGAMELNVRVGPGGATDVKVDQGGAILSNPLGEVELKHGEEGYAEPGRAPEKKLSPAPDSSSPPVR